MRTGKVVTLAHRNHGKPAAIIIEHLATLGFSTAEELENTVCAEKSFTAQGDATLHTNGHSRDHRLPTAESSRNLFRKMLRVLIDRKYIVAVRDAHFQSVFDARRDLERQWESLGLLPSSKLGKKSQADVDEKVDIELEQRLDPTIAAGTVLKELDSSHSQTSTVKTLLCVDYSNVVASVRNERIASIAEKVFGNPYGNITKAACSQIELGSSPFKVRDSDPNTMMQRLDVSLIDVSPSDLPNDTHPNDAEDGLLSNGGHVNGYHRSRSNGTKHDPVVDHHLAILADGPFFFLREDGSGSWLVNKKQLGDYVREKETMRLISERVDGPALRIVRMLVDKGKLDEKTLQELGLLGAKDLRQTLSQLQLMGYLELQEVPRDPQRQPNRTIFLWFYDAERVRKVFLGKIYKTMSRHYQRMHLERERLASTLSKVERTDVEGNVEDLLPEAELDLLYVWQQKEEWFLTELDRLDDSVAILRDI
ncbi:RNA polymerase III subunit C82 [Exophiala xenobiotica]|nr:RNA polymerase III subunit C82 [Exophiala xenobiotica]